MNALANSYDLFVHLKMMNDVDADIFILYVDHAIFDTVAGEENCKLSD